MPNWHLPTDEQNSSIDSEKLSQILQQITEETASNPTMEEVVGIQSQALIEHAMEAITAFMAVRRADPTDPTSWAQVYILGFVIGMKYERSHPAEAHIT